MSDKRPWLLIVAVMGVVFFAIVVGTVFYLIFGQTEKIESESVLELVLSGSLRDLPSQDPFEQVFGSSALSLWELEKVFRYASQDERISAIYLEIHPLTLNWAYIEELREYIKSFRESGKPVYAFLAVDMIGDSELYLASAANSITLNPDTALLVNGLLAEVTFYKGLLDKLSVKPEWFQFKEYKNAENYSREKLTPEMREMLESILRDMEERFVATVADDRNTDKATVRRFVEMGIATAEEAQRNRLVDSLGYRNEILSQLLGSESDRWDRKRVQASHYLQMIGDKFRIRSRHKVALLGGAGLITSGRSVPFSDNMGGTTMVSHLSRIRKNKNLKGVIFRVDSPGGATVGSDMIWKEVQLLEEADKPVVVSMSGVAGSGGYYISMNARHIVSQPSTITGSIGVLFGKFDLEGLYEWLGINVDRVKLSPNADILSFFTSLTDAQRQRVESLLEAIYVDFVSKAAEARGMSYEELEKKARGRIYTGVQAQNIGLVDELGGLRTAIARMKKLLELPDEEDIELVLYPRPVSLWERLRSGDLFSSRQPLDWIRKLKQEMLPLSRPAPWLISPEIHIY